MAWRQSYKMKKKIIISVSVFCSIAFIVSLILGIAAQNEEKSKIDYKFEQIKALEAEKASALKEIEDLEKEYNKKREEKATMQILLTSCDKEFFDKLYPSMQSEKLKGVIAFTLDDFPGENGNITMQELHNLIKEGWDYAVIWDGKGDFNKFMREAKDSFFVHRLMMPKTIYFKADRYYKKYDKETEEFGFNNVIHHGEEGMDKVTYQFTKPLLKLGSYPMMNLLSDDYYKKAASLGGNIIYEIDLDFMNEFSKEYMKEFLSALKKEVQSNDCLITTISQARDIHFNISDSDKALKKKYISERKALEERVGKIDQQMRDIYYEKNT